MTKIISKKQIKQKIDNNYQEIISCNEKNYSRRQSKNFTINY